MAEHSVSSVSVTCVCDKMGPQGKGKLWCTPSVVPSKVIKGWTLLLWPRNASVSGRGLGALSLTLISASVIPGSRFTYEN